MTTSGTHDWYRFYPEHAPHEIDVTDETIEQTLFVAAERFPQRVAIDYLGATVTYAQLLERSRRAATVFRSAGIRPGDVVALALPNCPQHLYAFYGAVLAGATVAEVNPLGTQIEITRELDLVAAKAFVAWEKTLETLAATEDDSRVYFSVNISHSLPLHSRLLLRLPVKKARSLKEKLRGQAPAVAESFDAALRRASAQPPDAFRPAPADADAVYLFTGGTTCEPKAVRLSHRNLVSNRKQLIAWVPFDAQSHQVEAGVLPFFHAFGLTMVLLTGVDLAATIILQPTFNAGSLLDAHKRHPITVFPGVAPMFSRVLKEVEAREAAGRPEDLSSIKFAVSGGMALAPSLATRWEEATKNYIIEGYGLTEASPVISGSPMNEYRRASTLGVPFPSTEVRLADPDHPDTTITEGPGEILVRGPQVCLGYLGDEAASAQTIVDGWLRTGDIGHWEDGFLVMADRRKEVIINNGFNIYPTEVEDAIRKIPGVSDVAVVGIPDHEHEERGESVVAALVLEPSTTMSLAQLRQWLEGLLPHYAMPTSFAIFESLPHSMLGKVLRKSVREQIERFQLVAGQWVRSATEVASDAASRAISAASSMTSRLASRDDPRVEIPAESRDDEQAQVCPVTHREDE